MSALSTCLACEASAERCQLKYHYSGRACCPDCHHEEIET